MGAETPANPYVGPYAFQTRDAARFTGRDGEAEALLSLVISERIVVFYSPSGAGKSSLLNARLIPGLRRKNFKVLPVVRVGGEFPAGVAPANVYTFNALWRLAGAQADPRQLQECSLDGFLRATQAKKAGTAPPRVLIFDQFEEILTTYAERWEQRREFFLQLRQALLDDSAFSVVMALREDRLAGLDTYAPLLPGQLRTRFRLETLRRREAVDAARKPALAAGRPFEPGVAERLIEDLARVRVAGQQDTAPGEFIEPVQLQVVCFQLWENLRQKPGTTITEEDRRESGDSDRALEAFYESAVRQAGEATGIPEARIRRWCGTALITSTRIRGQVSREAETSGGLPNAAVDELVNSHLVRAETARGGTWYELAHDRFIEPILRSNQRAAPSGASRLALDAQAWRDAGREPSFLYRGRRLEEGGRAAREAGELLTPLEREFITQSEKTEAGSRLRRAQRLWIVVAGLAVLLIAVAVLAVITWRQRQFYLSRGLALTAVSKADADPDLGLRLALEAARHSAAPEVEAALHEALAAAAVHKTAAIPISRPSAGAFAFSPDGRRFAAANEEGRMTLWETDSGRPIRSFELADTTFTSVAFSPDGDRLATGDLNDQVVVWDLGTGKTLASWQPGGTEVNSLAFSPDGTLLAVATGAPEPTLWNATSGKKIRTFAGGHTDGVWDVAFRPDGKVLASAGIDGRVNLWDVGSGRQTQPPLVHLAAVVRVAFSPRGGELATACHDKAGRIWDLQTGHLAQLFRGHSDWISDIGFSADGERLATASADGTAKIWDIGSGAEIRTLSPEVGPLVRIAFSSRPGWLATVEGSKDKAEVQQAEVTLWHDFPSVRTGPEYTRQQLATTDESGGVAVWDLSGRRLTAFTAKDPEPAPPSTPGSHARARLDPGGRHLAMEGLHGEVLVVDVPSRQGLLQIPPGTDSSVSALALSADGRRLAVAHQNGAVDLWDLATREHRPLCSQPLPVFDAEFSPDAKLLAVAGEGGAITLCEVAGGAASRRLTGHRIGIFRLAFNAAGTLLASAGVDRSVKLWDVSTGKERFTLEGHTSAVRALAFSPAGHRLASAADDGSLRLWDIENGSELFALRGHLGDVADLTFSQDGRLLAIIDADGIPRLEPMRIEDLLAQARSRLSRKKFTAQERRIYLDLD